MLQDVPFERVGGYRILRRLATGGTSDVLLARAEGPHGFERTVVLKLLMQQFRRDAAMEKMFAREAAAYSRLSHPAIVKLYDFFSAEGQLVMVLEFIDGLPLNRFRAAVRKHGDHVDDRASIFIASRVFAALAAAHAARDPEAGELAPVVHRDVNPSNILIPWDGHVKLADFGIAKLAGVSGDTQSGFIKGTYGYMSPEQVRGEPITVRTDVYAASLVLWELLARRKAVQRMALPDIEVLRAMAEPSLPSLHVLRPDLPQRLRDAIARGLEPSPEARSITAEEMLVVLRESVTSNEGRNVLAEAIARVREEEEAPRPPYPSPKGPPVRPVPVRAPSEVSIDVRARTELSTGQVRVPTGLTPEPGPLPPAPPPPPTVRTPPPPPAIAAPPKPPAAPVAAVARQVSTLSFGLVKEEVMAAAARSGADDKAPRQGIVAPPPTPRIGDLVAEALVGTNALTSTGAQPLVTPPLPMAAPAPASEPAPASVIPPPPAALLAVKDEYERNPSTVPSAFSPPTPAAGALATPASRSAPPAPPTPSRTPPATTSSAPRAVPRSAPPPGDAATLSAPPSWHPPSPSEPDPFAPPKSNAPIVLGAMAALASIGIVAAYFLSRGGSPAPAATTAAAPQVTVAAAAPPPTSRPAPAAVAPPAAPPRAATPTPTPTPTPTATATPTPPATPASSLHVSTFGNLVTPHSAAGHRVFVDGHYAGDSPGPIKVRCGKHTVKVGSGGVSRPVDVPCGGDVSVTPR